MKTNNKGFTIIELLVVIAIIGLLSSVVLVSMKGSTGKAKIAKSLEFSQTIMNVIGVDAVGIWTFDEGEGDYAYDKSGYGNHGTLKGKPDWVEGEENTPHWYVNEGEGRYALKFDGNDYVNCGSGNSLNITDAITIEAWVKLSSLGNHHTIWGGFNNSGCTKNYFAVNASNQLNWDQYPPGGGTSWTGSNSILTAKIWYHVAVVQSGTSYVKIYLNGVLDKETSSPEVYTGGTPTVWAIGSRYYSGSWAHGQFNGLIDEVRIYASALSSAEIQQHYADGVVRHKLAME